MASLTALRDALGTRLSTITDLHVYARIPDDVVTPAAVVEVEAVTWDTAFGGAGHSFAFLVRLLVQWSDPDTAQQALDDYLDTAGAASVKLAIEGDQTLGGVAQMVTATGARGFGLVEYAAVSYLSCEIPVAVWV